MYIQFGNLIKEYKDNFYLCTEERMVENKCFYSFSFSDTNDGIVYVDDDNYHFISKPFIRKINMDYFELVEYVKN